MMRPLRKEMQIVFQDPFGSLSPRLSIQQIVEEGLLVQGKTLSQDERRAIVAQGADRGRDSIPRPWTAIRTNSPAGSASASPLRARWRSNPRFIMLDEPTSALDMSVQAQIVDLLREPSAEAQSGLSLHQP